MSDRPTEHSDQPDQPQPDQTHLTANMKRPTTPTEDALLDGVESPTPHKATPTDIEMGGETLSPSPEAMASISTALIEVPGYEILRELGRGGMGVVYQARHLQLNRIVALKMILAGAHAGASDLARFRTEAEAVARLQHPGIAQIFEIGQHQGLPFFSLEL